MVMLNKKMQIKFVEANIRISIDQVKLSSSQQKKHLVVIINY